MDQEEKHHWNVLTKGERKRAKDAFVSVCSLWARKEMWAFDQWGPKGTRLDSRDWC